MAIDEDGKDVIEGQGCIALLNGLNDNSIVVRLPDAMHLGQMAFDTIFAVIVY